MVVMVPPPHTHTSPLLSLLSHLTLCFSGRRDFKNNFTSLGGEEEEEKEEGERGEEKGEVRGRKRERTLGICQETWQVVNDDHGKEGRETWSVN
jgi:hypothetical protein